MVQAPVDRLFLSHVMGMKHVPEVLFFCHSALLPIATSLCIVLLKESERELSIYTQTTETEMDYLCVI